MYICENCGELYDELPIRKEYHGELEGNWYETFAECSCGGNIEKAYECKVCGEWFSEDIILTEGVCDFCLHRELNAESIEEFIGTFEVEKCEFEINSAFGYIFSSEEVNEILMRELKKTLRIKHMKPLMLEDSINLYLRDDWARFLARKGA